VAGKCKKCDKVWKKCKLKLAQQSAVNFDKTCGMYNTTYTNIWEDTNTLILDTLALIIKEIIHDSTILVYLLILHRLFIIFVLAIFNGKAFLFLCFGYIK